MPALYVSNPRGKNGRFKKARRAAAASTRAPKRKATKRKKNPQQTQMTFSAAAKSKATRQRAPRKSAPRSTSATPRKRKRRIGTAAPRPGKRWAYRTNPRGRGGRFTSRRRRGGGRRKRNALAISNPVGGIPVIGTAVAMLMPAFFGAFGVEAIGQARKMLAKVVDIPDAIEPYEFTIGGLLLAGLVQLFTFIPASIRHSIGVGLASSGAAVDWFRYRQGSGAYGQLDMGDGGQWDVEQLGDAEAFGALEMAGLDLSGDEDFCGLDFSEDEGHAMAEGYGAYLARFPIKKHASARRPEDRPRRGTPASEIHDPRREGDRWHWLMANAKKCGWDAEDIKTLANMPPKQRLAQLKACKQAVKAVLNNPRTFSPQAPRQLEDRVQVETPTSGAPIRERVPLRRVDPFAQNAF